MGRIGGVALLAAWVGAAVLWALWAARPRGPVELVDGFRSYESAAAVHALLQSRGCQWRVTYDHSSLPGPAGEPVHELQASVHAYELYGCSGKLSLSFLNDRLMTVGFVPADAAAFLDALATRGGTDLRGGARVSRPGVRVETDRQTPGFWVRWDDVELCDERRRLLYGD